MHITKGRALSALQYAVTLRGADYIDPASGSGSPGCTYVRDGEPACIGAVALVHLGVDLDILQEADTQQAEDGFDPSLASSEMQEHLWISEVGAERAAWKILAEAQRAQDNGRTWGRALELAREVARDY
jgi:hypothetical protein